MKKHTCKHCGKEATYYFKSAKYWCCEDKFNKCEGWKILNKERLINRNISTKINKLRQLIKNRIGKCKYCGEEAKYIISNYKLCCSEKYYDCPEYSNWLSEVHKKTFIKNKSYRRNMSKAMKKVHNNPIVRHKKRIAMKKLHNKDYNDCKQFQHKYKEGINKRIKKTYEKNIKLLKENGYGDIVIPDDPKELAVIMNRLRANKFNKSKETK